MTTAKPDQVRATSSVSAGSDHDDDVVAHHSTWYDPDAAAFDEFEQGADAADDEDLGEDDDRR